jgi:hypothetical protein
MIGNNYFIRKRCWRVMFICQRIGVVHGVWVTHVDPSGGQAYPSTMSLYALLCPIFCRWLFFFFLLFSLFQKKMIFVLFSLDLSVSVLLFFVFYYRSWSYNKSFSHFQCSSWITICHIYIYSIQSLFFWFFSLNSFVKVLLVFTFIFQLKFMFFMIFNVALILLIYFF